MMLVATQSLPGSGLQTNVTKYKISYNIEPSVPATTQPVIQRCLNLRRRKWYGSSTSNLTSIIYYTGSSTCLYYTRSYKYQKTNGHRVAILACSLTSLNSLCNSVSVCPLVCWDLLVLSYNWTRSDLNNLSSVFFLQFSIFGWNYEIKNKMIYQGDLTACFPLLCTVTENLDL